MILFLPVFVSLALLGLMAYYLSRTMLKMVEALEENTAELTRLRIAKANSRMSRAGMQSGATSEEQLLRRLGRASVGRRVVVGGDPDSELNQNLEQQNPLGGGRQ